MATVLLAGAWRSRKRWPIWTLGALFFGGVLGLLGLTRTPRFADLTNLTSGTGFFRIKLWQGAWRMALDHPALGVGPDNFLYAYRTRYVLPSAWQELNLSHPHNLILDLATRLGVLGVLAGAWAMIGGLLRGWRLLRSGGDAVWPLALGLLGGLAATVAHGLIDNSLFLIDLMALFMLTLGLLQRLGESANQRMNECRRIGKSAVRANACHVSRSRLTFHAARSTQYGGTMRILVTGGAGFVGSHLCDRLLGDGHDVIAMDNLITGSTDNIAHLAGNRHFKFIFHDVTEYIYVPGALDAVMNLASPASPVDFARIPIPILKVGSLGTHNTLGLALAKRARYLIASTSEVYGDPLIHPQPETYWGNVNPIGVRGVYDEAKRFSEAITMAYHRVHGVDTRIIRIFNTYGPRMRLSDGRVVPNFIGQALRGEPLTVYGDGSQTRSFCFVSDLVDGMVRLLLSSETDPVNVGNPAELTILAFAQIINRLTGNEAGIAFKPLPVDDPRVRRPDITRARTILGWEPQVAVEDGLKQTIEYFRAKL